MILQHVYSTYMELKHLEQTQVTYTLHNHTLHTALGVYWNTLSKAQVQSGVEIGVVGCVVKSYTLHEIYMIVHMHKYQPEDIGAKAHHCRLLQVMQHGQQWQLLMEVFSRPGILGLVPITMLQYKLVEVVGSAENIGLFVAYLTMCQPELRPMCWTMSLYINALLQHQPPPQVPSTFPKFNQLFC